MSTSSNLGLKLRHVEPNRCIIRRKYAYRRCRAPSDPGYDCRLLKVHDCGPWKTIVNISRVSRSVVAHPMWKTISAVVLIAGSLILKWVP